MFRRQVAGRCQQDRCSAVPGEHSLSSRMLSKERGGSGNLTIDGKKVWAIKHWMEKTSVKALEVVAKTLLDYPFQYGPYGEVFSLTTQMFLGSQAEETLANPEASLAPLTGEATISVDWLLPLDGDSQTWLFERIRLAYQKATMIVEEPREKKKYRMKAEEMLHLRSVLALWAQLRDFCSSRLTDFQEFDRKLKNSSVLDAQFADILEQRPKAFGISMLPVARESAAVETRAAEETATAEADKQRIELRAARWKYFTAALQRDQRQLELVIEAPAKLEALRHRREMAWRSEQAKLGEKLVLSYCEKYLKSVQVKKMELIHEQVHTHREFVELWAHLVASLFSFIFLPPSPK